jgi:hypothetical protein
MDLEDYPLLKEQILQLITDNIQVEIDTDWDYDGRSIVVRTYVSGAEVCRSSVGLPEPRISY